jgi:hypothetical protein
LLRLRSVGLPGCCLHGRLNGGVIILAGRHERAQHFVSDVVEVTSAPVWWYVCGTCEQHGHLLVCEAKLRHSRITIIALPSKCPELNPVENVWEFMPENWLSNRVFSSYDDLVDHCCGA